jgi:hypothetical protein
MRWLRRPRGRGPAVGPARPRPTLPQARRSDTIEGVGGGRGRFVAYGNCQLDEIRARLAMSPEFTARYEFVDCPSVHLVNPDAIAELRELVAEAALVVVQPVDERYRELGFGTRTIRATARGDVFMLPSLYFEGLFPLQAHVGHPEHADAPVTVYHDLRTLHCAARGMSLERARRLWADYAPPPAAVRSIADESLAELRRREGELDITISDLLEDPAVLARSFWTINHPTEALLDPLADRILARVGLDPIGSPRAPGEEPLGALRTPVEPSVAAALGLPMDGTTDWLVAGHPWPVDEILRVHLDWYAANPLVVRQGLERHGARLERLLLAP